MGFSLSLDINKQCGWNYFRLKHKQNGSHFIAKISNVKLVNLLKYTYITFYQSSILSELMGTIRKADLTIEVFYAYKSGVLSHL